jgi:hypothetical protein
MRQNGRGAVDMAVSYQFAQFAGMSARLALTIVTNGKKRTICLTVQNA